MSNAMQTIHKLRNRYCDYHDKTWQIKYSITSVVLNYLRFQNTFLQGHFRTVTGAKMIEKSYIENRTHKV